MTYKGYEIAILARQWQSWELDDSGKPSKIFKHFATIFESSDEYELWKDGIVVHDPFISVEDAKRFIDMETEQAGAL